MYIKKLKLIKLGKIVVYFFIQTNSKNKKSKLLFLFFKVLKSLLGHIPESCVFDT